MAIGLGIDVYGTLVDPIGISDFLRSSIGNQAERLAELWRTKQLEYTFRRAAMGCYKNFDVCTAEALSWVIATLKINLTGEETARVLEQYKKLDAYPDVASGLASLKRRGYSLYAFSNGVESSLRQLLEHAGLYTHLDGIVSVDGIGTFKPDPRVYHHLVGRLGTKPGDTWLISSNPFDIIGAKAASLNAAWIKRNANAVFDPWDIEPDLVVTDLNDLARQSLTSDVGSSPIRRPQ
jgi:2-haloacid dehalogenase